MGYDILMTILRSFRKIVVTAGGMKMLGTPRKEHAMSVAKLVISNQIALSSREKRRSHHHSKEGAKAKVRKPMLHGKVEAHLPLHHQALAQVVKMYWQMCA
jgi:CO/xanthine dehydrogenase FAD-binding subunit